MLCQNQLFRERVSAHDSSTAPIYISVYIFGRALLLSLSALCVRCALFCIRRTLFVSRADWMCITFAVRSFRWKCFQNINKLLRASTERFHRKFST